MQHRPHSLASFFYTTHSPLLLIPPQIRATPHHLVKSQPRLVITCKYTHAHPRSDQRPRRLSPNRSNRMFSLSSSETILFDSTNGRPTTSPRLVKPDSSPARSLPLFPNLFLPLLIKPTRSLHSAHDQHSKHDTSNLTHPFYPSQIDRRRSSLYPGQYQLYPPRSRLSLHGRFALYPVEDHDQRQAELGRLAFLSPRA